MRSPLNRNRIECDGCGVPARGRAPRGWFDRALDPPYYTGSRRLRFCPQCYAGLLVTQQRRWSPVGARRRFSRFITVAHRLVQIPPAPRRGSVG
jgi:hypothetical protein